MKNFLIAMGLAAVLGAVTISPASATRLIRVDGTTPDLSNFSSIPTGATVDAMFIYSNSANSDDEFDYNGATIFSVSTSTLGDVQSLGSWNQFALFLNGDFNGPSSPLSSTGIGSADPTFTYYLTDAFPSSEYGTSPSFDFSGEPSASVVEALLAAQPGGTNAEIIGFSDSSSSTVDYANGLLAVWVVQPNSVPEPSGWLMFLGGFACIAFLARRSLIEAD